MAERRMFSKRVIDTDAFLDLPPMARLLYYELSMRADDDGFVASPKRITRMTGCSPEDLASLEGGRFIIPFESGPCVIKDWRVHNYIRGDRYHETQYLEEKRRLLLTENGSYETAPPGMPVGIPPGPQGLPQVRSELGSGLIPPYPPQGEGGGGQKTRRHTSENLGVQMAPGAGGKKPARRSGTLCDEGFQAFWTAYPRKAAKHDAAKAWGKLRPDEALRGEIMAGLARAVNCGQWTRDQGRYIPYAATWLNQRRWEDEYPAQEGFGELQLMN